jgi:4-hydroxybenzoate polyprenyltransferase
LHGPLEPPLATGYSYYIMAGDTRTGASDIPKGGWVDRRMPARCRPYIRLARFDRPIGTWLLLFPCWWSIAMAQSGSGNGLADFRYFVLFGLGALVMRGAGCAYNDIMDRGFDAQVARTRDRPLPSGQITVPHAVVFMIVLLALGGTILFSFNRFAVMTGLASLVLVFTYPLMKRVTFWPQLFLGFAFNWGALLGWAAVRGELAAAPVLLYAGGIFWTLGYDTIYAHQDRRDDVVAGVKSSARALGLGKPWLYAFYAAAIVLFAAAGVAGAFTWPYFAGLALGGAQLMWQVWDADLDDPHDCLAKFKSNRLFGWLFLAAILAGWWV